MRFRLASKITASIAIVTCLLLLSGQTQAATTPYAEKSWESPKLGDYVYDFWGLEACDIDGDSQMEILASTQYKNNVSIFSGATGALEGNLTCANYSGSSYIISYVDAAEADGDSGLEVICGWYGMMGGFTVTDGLTKAVEWSKSVMGLEALTVADIDGDGKSEIVTGEGAIKVYRPKDHTTGPTSPAITGDITDIFVGDVDGASGSEVVVAVDEFSGNGRLLVLDGQTLAVEVNVTVSGSPTTVCVADLDGTGNRIVLGEGGIKSGTISYQGHVYIYKPDGTLDWQSQDLGKEVTNIAVADIDANQQKELVLTTDRVEVWRASNRTSIWTGPQLISVGDSDALAIADFNADGKKDIAVRWSTYSSNNHVVVYKVNGLSQPSGTGNTGGNQNNTGNQTGGGDSGESNSFIDDYWMPIVVVVVAVVAVVAVLAIRTSKKKAK